MEFGTDVTRCAQIVSAGGVAVVATDTLYGLAANIHCAEAVGRVLTIKGREIGRGIPVLANDWEQAAEITEFGDEARRLSDVFWPGGLTMVLPASESIDHRLQGPASTVGIRVPDSNVVQRIIEIVGAPITGTSANYAGELPPSTAQAAADVLGNDVDYVLNTEVGSGTASTIIHLGQTPPVVLREGVIASRELSAILPGLRLAPDR